MRNEGGDGGGSETGQVIPNIGEIAQSLLIQPPSWANLHPLLSPGPKHLPYLHATLLFLSPNPYAV